MNWRQDPPRLIQGNEADTLVRLLQAGQAELPTADQLEPIAERLAPWFTGPGGGAGGGAAGAASSGALGASGAAAAAGSAASISIAKAVTAVVLGVAAVASGAVAVQTYRSHSTTVAVPSSSASLALSSTVPPSASAEPVSPSPQDSAITLDQRPPTTPPLPKLVSSVSSADPLEGLSEVALLQQAQSAVASDPSRALALTLQHSRRFPAGTLGQEREALAIQALVNLGRTAEARARAQSFAKAYPTSAYLRRFEVLVGPLTPASAEASVD